MANGLPVGWIPRAVRHAGPAVVGSQCVRPGWSLKTARPYLNLHPHQGLRNLQLRFSAAVNERYGPGAAALNISPHWRGQGAIPAWT